mgnify:CR=1 FL=1
MIARHNILDLLGSDKRKYHSCIITCYSFDFIFFEQRVLPKLRQAGITNINIYVDASQFEKQIKEKLKTATNPIAQSLHSGTGFNVLLLGFNKGMVLKEHKTRTRAKLTVLEGLVFYREGNRVVELQQFDEIDIPVDVLHAVEAAEDSLCLLTKGE